MGVLATYFKHGWLRFLTAGRHAFFVAALICLAIAANVDAQESAQNGASEAPNATPVASQNAKEPGQNATPTTPEIAPRATENAPDSGPNAPPECRPFTETTPPPCPDDGHNTTDYLAMFCRVWDFLNNVHQRGPPPDRASSLIKVECVSIDNIDIPYCALQIADASIVNAVFHEESDPYESEYDISHSISPVMPTPGMPYTIPSPDSTSVRGHARHPSYRMESPKIPQLSLFKIRIRSEYIKYAGAIVEGIDKGGNVLDSVTTSMALVKNSYISDNSILLYHGNLDSGVIDHFESNYNYKLLDPVPVRLKIRLEPSEYISGNIPDANSPPIGRLYFTKKPNYNSNAKLTDYPRNSKIGQLRSPEWLLGLGDKIYLWYETSNTSTNASISASLSVKYEDSAFDSAYITLQLVGRGIYRAEIEVGDKPTSSTSIRIRNEDLVTVSINAGDQAILHDVMMDIREMGSDAKADYSDVSRFMNNNINSIPAVKEIQNIFHGQQEPLGGFSKGMDKILNYTRRFERTDNIDTLAAWQWKSDSKGNGADTVDVAMFTGHGCEKGFYMGTAMPGANVNINSYFIGLNELVLGDNDLEIAIFYSCLAGNADLDTWKTCLSGGLHWVLAYRTVYFGKPKNPRKFMEALKANHKAPVYSLWFTSEKMMGGSNRLCLDGKEYYAWPRAIGWNKSMLEPIPCKTNSWHQYSPDYERFTEDNDIKSKGLKFDGTGGGMGGGSERETD